jgi:2'-5' RNA ligase
MPWHIEKRGSRHCVVKNGESTPVPGGCHATRAEAIRHQRALYAGEAVSEIEVMTNGDEKPLAMVALYPRAEEAEALATDGGHEANDLHVTLVFLGEAEDVNEDLVTEAAGLVASELNALQGVVGGVGQFAEQEDGRPAILLPDVNGLTLLRERLVDELGHRGIRSPSEHGFLPHMTLRYADKEELPDASAIGQELHFDDVSVVVGDRRTDYPLSGARVASAEGSTVMQKKAIFDSLGNVIGWTSGNGSDEEMTISFSSPGFTPTLSNSSATNQVSMPPDSEAEWEGVLAVEGIATADGRYLMPGKIGHRELPLTLMAQKVTDEGHKGAEVAGKIVEIRREQRSDLGDDAVAIIGRGVFADTEEGLEAATLLADEVLRGVSIDFAPTATHLLDPETLEILDEDSLDVMDLLGGQFVRGFEGKIMGATLCAFPAFEESTMEIVETPDKVVVASIFMRALTASAAGLAPLLPPYDWFFKPEPSEPCPLTVTPQGEVYGHLALWNQCHRSIADHCEMAPRSRSGYAYFHTGSLATADGRNVNVGRITVGNGGHASVSSYLGTQGAIEHYDKTGLVGAFVRATDGNHGIWLSGAVRSDCPAEKVRDMQANPPSGDWREEKGRLELCAALSVPVAGFPVPRYEAALVASGADERVVALVASGYTEPGMTTRKDQRKFEQLKKTAWSALTPKIDERAWADDGSWLGELESDDFQRITAEGRRRAAARGAALPDGSFPIEKCRGEGPSAENAIRAQGRADPAKRGRVRAHIRRRVRSLGCSGPIFEKYR